jgi:hypothetical protein
MRFVRRPAKGEVHIVRSLLAERQGTVETLGWTSLEVKLGLEGREGGRESCGERKKRGQT